MSYRKLEINGETWEYSIGSGAKIRSPKNKTVVWIDGWELLGFESKEQYTVTIRDRTAYDDENEVASIHITPRIVRKYIEENLI